MFFKGCFKKRKAIIPRSTETLVDQILTGFVDEKSISSDRIRALLNNEQVELSQEERSDLRDILTGKESTKGAGAKEKYDEEDAKRWELSNEKRERQELRAMRRLSNEELLTKTRRSEIALADLKFEFLWKLLSDKSLKLTQGENVVILRTTKAQLKRARERNYEQGLKLLSQRIELSGPNCSD